MLQDDETLCRTSKELRVLEDLIEELYDKYGRSPTVEEIEEHWFALGDFITCDEDFEEEENFRNTL